MSDRPTPETDAVNNERYSHHSEGYSALLELSRRLERERDAWQDVAMSGEILRKKAEGQRDRLMEACLVAKAELERRDGAGTCPTEIEDAIASVKGGMP